MSTILQCKVIEGQTFVNGRNNAKQISFRGDITLHWTPHIPGEDSYTGSLCFDGNLSDNKIWWSENFNGKVPFGSLCYTEQREVLNMLGIESDSTNSIADWLLEQDEGIVDLLDIEPVGLRRLVCFPKTNIHEEKPSNGIYFRKDTSLLCRSQAGLFFSSKWIREFIILGELG